MQLNYATRIAQGSPPEAVAEWRPVASALSRLFTGLDPHGHTLEVLHGVFFWAHLMLVLGFLVYLGFSKHLHIITSTPNVFFLNLNPKGDLPTPDFEAPEIDHFGASKLEHFAWKDVLDLYTCTECGRCQTHCPAYNTGKPLSPKTLITDLRDLVYEDVAGGYAAHPPTAPIRSRAGCGSPRRTATPATACSPATSSRPPGRAPSRSRQR